MGEPHVEFLVETETILKNNKMENVDIEIEWDMSTSEIL